MGDREKPRMAKVSGAVTLNTVARSIECQQKISRSKAIPTKVDITVGTEMESGACLIYQEQKQTRLRAPLLKDNEVLRPSFPSGALRIGKRLIDSRISRKTIRRKYAAIQRDNHWT